MSVIKKCAQCGYTKERERFDGRQKPIWAGAGYSFCNKICSDSYNINNQVSRMRSHYVSKHICSVCAMHDRFPSEYTVMYKYVEVISKGYVCDICGKRIPSGKHCWSEERLDGDERVEALEFREHWNNSDNKFRKPVDN